MSESLLPPPTFCRCGVGVVMDAAFVLSVSLALVAVVTIGNPRYSWKLRALAVPPVLLVSGLTAYKFWSMIQESSDW